MEVITLVRLLERLRNAPMFRGEGQNYSPSITDLEPIDSFSFKEFDNKITTYDEINSSEEKLKIVFPKEYKEFLTMTKGIRWISSSNFGIPYFVMFNLESVASMIERSILQNGVYSIGMMAYDNIVINSSEVSTGKYIYACSSVQGDNFKPLGTDFITFLDRAISVNFQRYWDWNSSAKIYDFSKK